MNSTEFDSPHALTTQEVLQRLAVEPTKGLSEPDAHARLQRYGPNSITSQKGRSLARLLLSQVSDFMIIVLLAAAVISGLIGAAEDAIAIIVIVVLNAAFGAVQEFRAQKAVAALQRLAAPEAHVVRDGALVTTSADNIVPGDIVSLEAGNVVPADLRLIDTTDLHIDESALTGESQAVNKQPAVLAEADLPIGDRRNLCFKDSLVTRGKGSGVVVATGDSTQIGRIASLLRERSSTKTPLQQRLARFGWQLSIAILALCALIFAIGLLRGEEPLLMFLTAVSLAVAAVPEALPAVVTVGLALGARKLAAQNTLVRRLPAVESLGSVTFICADKTGTLTTNQMTLRRVYANQETYEDLLGLGSHSALARHLGSALLLNNDVRQSDGEMTGDPSELAMYRAATDAGHDAELRSRLPRIGEFAFSEARKRMTTVHQADDSAIAYVKGAPESVLPLCTHAMHADHSRVIDVEHIQDQAHSLAGQGYRVMAVAMRDLEDPVDLSNPEKVERNLSFLALVALIDPPRPEVPMAVAECKAAGIVPVMITGDHPETARHIAEQLDIATPGSEVMTGRELSALSDDEFANRVANVRVYARVDPAQKIRIVDALTNSGEFVAMTGDGVNDAPALTSSAIGVAMGKRGTDVAREAADMVLLDDNFATIVAAIRDGRRIFDNIRKFIKYTMTSNSGEIWTLLLAPLIGLPIPLLPIHILWINLLTDGLPGLAFTAEKAESDIMRRAPRPPDQNIFAGGMTHYILWIGLLIGALSIGGQYWTYHRGVEHWQTMTFTVLVVAQLFNALAVRSERQSLLRIGLLSNPPMLWAIAVTIALQLAVIYIPVLNPIFKTQALPLSDLAACIGLGAVVLVAAESLKLILNRNERT